MRFTRLVLPSLVAVAVPACVLADSVPGTISGDYLETRNMTEDDHLCGNAELCYPL